MTRSRCNSIRLGTLAACAALVASAGVANAQSALGDGRALDRSTRVGSGGINSANRFGSPELNFRNAIVTGNAPGGLSFRGDIDYTAPMDFRGELGSEDLFAFTRDSYFSGLAASPFGQRFRGADALQFQMQVSAYGASGRPGGFEPVLSRGTAPSLQADGQTVSTSGASARMYEPLVTRPGALRSTSEFITGDALSPTVLGRGEGAAGEMLYALASPLGSVSMQPELTPSRAPSPNLLSAPIAGETPADEAIDDRVTARLDPARVVHAEILESLRQARERERQMMDEAARAPAEGEDAEETFEERIERIRRQLSDPNADPEQVRDLIRRTLPEDADRINRLITPRPDRDLFAEHMEKGQEHLAEDRWFEAEERFTSAIAMRPTDPVAAAGRVHAQLGGALYRSAGENLKSLLRDHPEMIAARYDQSLLPRGARLDAVRVALRELARNDTEFARASALLLAYLAHQYDNDRDIEIAFSEIDRISRALGDTPDPIYAAARAAWAPQDVE